MCIPGDTVLSGSYLVEIPRNLGSIQDIALTTQDGWVTTAFGPSDPADSVIILTVAQCFNNP